MQIAKIAVEAATYAIDKPYSYGVPAGMDVSVGCRVLVPFGRGNRTSEGIVLSLEECLPNGPLKALRLNLDGAPVISPREIKLAFWMRQRWQMQNKMQHWRLQKRLLVPLTKAQQ